MNGGTGAVPSLPYRDATAGVAPLIRMDDEPSGRKHPVHEAVHERFNTPIIVFVTVCAKNKKRILANTEVHHVLRDAWHAADSWLVGRYVIMPNHLHFFCAPGSSLPRLLSQWVAFWKSTAARNWPRREDAPIWQRHCWDTQLRRAESYDAEWDYVLQNPVRARLVARSEDWPYQGEMNVLRW
jgi:putative transposase